CQASAPPRCQPVPSAQARIVSPFLLTATAGCFRAPEDPGAATGADASNVSGSILAKKTWPAVSHAATILPESSANDSLLIGQVATRQGWSDFAFQGWLWSCEVTRIMARPTSRGAA